MSSHAAAEGSIAGEVSGSAWSFLLEGSALRRAVLVGYVVTLFLIPLPKLHVRIGPTRAQAADFVFLVTALLWVACVARRELPLVGRKVVWPLAGLVGMALVSFTVSANLGHSLVKLVGLGYLVTLGAVTASLGATRRGLRFVLGTWVSGAALTVVLGFAGVLLFYAGVRDRSINFVLWTYGTVPVGSFPRIAILFDNANMLCSYLIVTVGACLGLRALVESTRLRAVLLAGAAMTSFVCLFTLSTGIGGLALGIAVAWAILRHRRGGFSIVREGAILVAGAAAAVGMMVATVFLLVPKGAGQLTVGPFDLLLAESGRVSAWKGAVRTILEHPLRGVGIGAMVSFVTNPRAAHSMEHWGTERMDKPVALHMEAHNVWLNVAGQMGLPALFAFVALMVLVVRGLLPRGRDDTELGELRIVLFGTFVAAVLYHGLAAALEDSRQYWYLFGTILAAKLVSGVDGEAAEKAAT